jgi:hypothetical protein
MRICGPYRSPLFFAGSNHRISAELKPAGHGPVVELLLAFLAKNGEKVTSTGRNPAYRDITVESNA